MTDENFYQEVDCMFEEYLSNGDIPKIIIKDVLKNKPLNINYKKILFDSDLNFYKIEEDKITLVTDTNYKAFVVKKQ